MANSSARMPASPISLSLKLRNVSFGSAPSDSEASSACKVFSLMPTLSNPRNSRLTQKFRQRPSRRPSSTLGAAIPSKLRCLTPPSWLVLALRKTVFTASLSEPFVNDLVSIITSKSSGPIGQARCAAWFQPHSLRILCVDLVSSPSATPRSSTSLKFT